MAYEVVLIGRAQGALLASLMDRLGPDAIREHDGTLTLLLHDKSALLAVLEQLHDLNVSIETVQHIE
jgi:hypothetical protein